MNKIIALAVLTSGNRIVNDSAAVFIGAAVRKLLENKVVIYEANAPGAARLPPSRVPGRCYPIPVAPRRLDGPSHPGLKTARAVADRFNQQIVVVGSSEFYINYEPFIHEYWLLYDHLARAPRGTVFPLFTEGRTTFGFERTVEAAEGSVCHLVRYERVHDLAGVRNSIRTPEEHRAHDH